VLSVAVYNTTKRLAWRAMAIGEIDRTATGCTNPTSC